MLMSNLINLWVGQLGLRLWVKVVSAPESLIFSATILLCTVGVWMATGGAFGLFCMLMFAVLGYLMTAFGYSVVIFMIAFFLGPQLETSIAQGLVLTNGELTQLVKHPVALALFGLAIASFVWFIYKVKTQPADVEAEEVID
jgi:putative tricarboxylic transport membrane protein